MRTTVLLLRLTRNSRKNVMFKRTHIVAWLFTGILLWPLLALIADESFGQRGSDAVAYAGIAIVIYLYVDAFRLLLKRSRHEGMRFTYRTYRVAIRRGYDSMWKTHSLYKDSYTHRGLWRDAVSKVIRIQMRRKREKQRWPMQRYIANTAIARSLARSTEKETTPAKCGAIPETP